MKKISLFIIVVTFLFSCTDTADYMHDGDQPKRSTMSVKDTINILDAHATDTLADIFTQYDGKTYSLESRNANRFLIAQSGSNIELSIEDTSELPIKTALKIVVNSASLQTPNLTIDLADSDAATLTEMQTFGDGTTYSNDDVDVLSGTLVLTYDALNGTVSGRITNLKYVLGYFVDETIGIEDRNENAQWLIEGGSWRTLNLSFENIPEG